MVKGAVIVGSIIVAHGGNAGRWVPGVTTAAPACAGRPTLPGVLGIMISNPNCDDTITKRGVRPS